MEEQLRADWQRYGVLIVITIAVLVALFGANIYLKQKNEQLNDKITKIQVDKKEVVPVTVSDQKASELTNATKNSLDELLDGKPSVANQSTLNHLTSIFLQTGKAVPTLKQTEQQRRTYFKGFKYHLDDTGAIKLQGGYHLVGRLTTTFNGHPTEARESIVDFGLSKSGIIKSVTTYTALPGGEDQ